MTTNKYESENYNCCSPQWVSDHDYEKDAGPCSDKSRILINPPPQDGECMICRRPITELEAFDEPGDPILGDFAGAKLIKMWREDYPGYARSSWECRDCITRPGPLWAIEEEDRLGRRLTQREYIDMRYKLELSMLEIHEVMNPAES